MYQTTDFRKGLKIEYDNKVFVIVEFQHVNPGKGSAFVRTKLKNLENGKVLDVTFKAGVDKVGIPDIETTEMQYLFSDGNSYTFMDNKSYDQVALSNEDVGDAKFYLKENSMVRVTIFNGKPVAIDIDNFVELEVKETQPNIKGDTSSGGGKPATMETGLTITVPFHINAGDILKIDTRTNKYIEKVKG
ncbi:MAG: elongation factor P [Zetaproteobacteria bacterium]|nr:elongation factor P [Pseudobdellovibrionaceae bacterium]|tara:strand:+ start:1374 stop:1940 length:567 start_codon:yes stop_codon:yes gene_type:complete